MVQAGVRRLSDSTYLTPEAAAQAGRRWAEGGPNRLWSVQHGPEPGDELAVGDYVVTLSHDGSPAHCTCPGWMYSVPHTCKHCWTLIATGQANPPPR
jgi:hypothetical protein